VRRGLEGAPEGLFGVLLRRNEEVDDGAVEQVEVAAAQQRGARHAVRTGAQRVQRREARFEGRVEAVLRVAEVDEVLLEVGKLRAVLLGEPPGQARREVPHGELALVVVGVVCPVLLDVHLVGIEARQRNGGLVVLVDQFQQEGKRAVAEVVHLGRLAADHDQHAVERAEVGLTVSAHCQPAAPRVRPIALALALLDCQRTFQPDDPRRVDVIEPALTHPLLAKRIGLGTGPDQLDRPLVVRPVELLPERDAEPAGVRVAIPFTVLDPLARLAGRLRVGRADLQG
jgi:hypothetical protein